MRAVRLEGAGVWRLAVAGVVDGAPGAVAVALLYATGLWSAAVWTGEAGVLWPDQALEALAYRPMAWAQPWLVWGLTWCLWRFCWLYFGGGRTPGMRVVGVGVVDRWGAPPGLGVCGLRVVGEVLTLLSLGLGALWALVSRERRTWADVISSSYVVRR